MYTFLADIHLGTKLNNIDQLKSFNLFLDIIKKHEDSGLIINSPTNIKLTKRGLDLSNLVEVDFLK